MAIKKDKNNRSNIRGRVAWFLFIVVLIILAALELVIHRHSYFGLEGTPLFSVWYGFISAVILILLTKLAGIFLKRPPDFYEEDE